MRIAFFSHNFLEPTHHAIAAILGRLTEHKYTVFAKRFLEGGAEVPNVVARVTYDKGRLSDFTRDWFDLVHAIFDGKTALRAAEHAHRAGLPFVLSFHGGFDVKAKVFDPRYSEATRRIAEWAASVTVPSALDEARLRTLGVQRPVEIIPVPIDSAILPRARPPDPRRLVCVARLVPKKGVDLALRVLRVLPAHSLDIVGDGPLRGYLEVLAARLEIVQRVRFLGMLPLRDTLDTMANAAALLHPGRVAADGNAEGTPQAILWAQALGVPVVTTPTGSIPDIVRDGESGMLVPPEDVGELVGAIRRLDAEPVLREALAKGGRRVIVGHQLERVVEQVRALYRQANATVPV